jgi:hypothetical protein
MKIAIAPVIHLLHEAPHAILSTHSTQLPGFPYGTAIPLVLDELNQPVLLISALAEHTKNLLADSRASIAIVEPGKSNVQDAARLTLVGRAETFTPAPELVQRYLRYQPDAEQYLQLDFMFFRFKPNRARFIGGVGKMGWLEGQEWSETGRISLTKEVELLSAATAEIPKNIRLRGIDAFGIDYEMDGLNGRLRFDQAQTCDTLKSNLSALIEQL